MPAPGEWRKSSYSTTGPDCAEVAFGGGVRDSKDPGAGQLTLDLVAYRAFLGFASTAGCGTLDR